MTSEYTICDPDITVCPYCGNTDLDHDLIHIGPNFIESRDIIDCLKCNRRLWEET